MGRYDNVEKRMNITFGICLGPKFEEKWLVRLVNSIASQRWDGDEYEILCIGGYPGILDNVKKLFTTTVYHISFDEFTKPMWITKKKNILADVARFDNIVIVHDYFRFSDGWLEGVRTHDKAYPNWRVLLNRVENLEGT